MHRLAVAIAALGGLAAGVLIGPRLLHGKRDVRHADTDVVPVAAAPSGSEQDARRLAALEARLGRMEAASVLREAESRRTSAAPAEAPERRDPFDVSPAAAQQRLQSLLADRRALHDSEPVDATWARIAEPGLNADLQKIAPSDDGKAGFVVKGVQCKTTSCAAELAFPGYGDVGAAASRLLHGLYSQPCGTTMLAPEPADPKAPYTLTFYLDCAERS